MVEKNGFRFFQGRESNQVDGNTGKALESNGWYCEPVDYEGDVAWSGPHATLDEAVTASETIDQSV